MSDEGYTTDVLIVGAGLAGLMAANALLAQGWRVVVLEGQQEVGGRLATRRVGPGRADHGAQFFTVRTPEFQVWVDQWITEELVYRWSTGWSDGSLSQVPSDGHPRYAVRGGMAALAQRLAYGVDVQVGTPLATLTPTPRGWWARDATGQTHICRAVLLTPPVPQALALLEGSQVALAGPEHAALAAIDYDPCLAGIFWVDGSIYLPQPGAIQRPDAPIAWIADNQRKGISPQATLITVHAGADYSRQLWDEPEGVALEALRRAIDPYLDRGATVRQAHLERWHYASPRSSHAERSLLAAGLPPLAFAGDAFGGPRVEGAALSGMAAAQALMGRLQATAGR